MPESAKCSWEIRAGMVPGQPIAELTRQFHVSSSEYEAAGKVGPESGGLTHVFIAKQFQAYAYANELQTLCANGRTCNWVELTFVWY